MEKAVAAKAGSTPTNNKVFLYTHEARKAVMNHCMNEFPFEACGLISGRNGIASTVWPMKNEDQSADSFSMSLREIAHVFDLIEKKNEEVLAIYHSHPTSSAYPSPGDIRYNNYPELAHIIVSLLKPLPEVKAFHIKGSQVTHLKMELV